MASSAPVRPWQFPTTTTGSHRSLSVNGMLLLGCPALLGLTWKAFVKPRLSQVTLCVRWSQPWVVADSTISHLSLMESLLRAGRIRISFVRTVPSTPDSPKQTLISSSLSGCQSACPNLGSSKYTPTVPLPGRREPG